MKYTIQKIFGSYSICIENDYISNSFYDVQKEIIDIIKQLEQENQKYKEVIEKLKDAIKECWYMDSENIGEQVFLKKIELQNILKEVE